jgi:hypothetical protein
MVVIMMTTTLSLDTSVAVNNIFRKECMLPPFLQMLQSNKPCTRSIEIKNTTTVLWCQVIRNHIYCITKTDTKEYIRGQTEYAKDLT